MLWTDEDDELVQLTAARRDRKLPNQLRHAICESSVSESPENAKVYCDEPKTSKTNKKQCVKVALMRVIRHLYV